MHFLVPVVFCFFLLILAVHIFLPPNMNAHFKLIFSSKMNFNVSTIDTVYKSRLLCPIQCWMLNQFTLLCCASLSVFIIVHGDVGRWICVICMQIHNSTGKAMASYQFVTVLDQVERRKHGDNSLFRTAEMHFELPSFIFRFSINV